jgi:hypothetical protein
MDLIPAAQVVFFAAAVVQVQVAVALSHQQAQASQASLVTQKSR